MEEEIKTEQVVRPPLVLPSRSRLTTLTTPSLYGGRFTRKQFWGHILALFLVALFIAAFGGILVYSAFSGGLDADGFVGTSIVVMIFLATISLCVNVFWSLPVFFKRMHDIGGSGWLVILVLFGSNLFELFVPGLGAITGLIFFITLGSLDSEKGTNKYGASIKYPDLEVHECQERELTKITWKNVLSCNGYYSKPQFVLHAVGAAFLALITAYSFMFARGYLEQLAYIESNPDILKWLIMGFISCWIVFFSPLAFPAFIKRYRDAGYSAVLPIVLIIYVFLTTFICPAIDSVMSNVEYYILGTESDDIINLRLALSYGEHVIYLALCCVVVVRCLAKSAPVRIENNTGSRGSLNWLNVVSVFVTALLMWQGGEVRQWLRIRCGNPNEVAIELERAVLSEDIEKALEIIDMERLTDFQLNRFHEHNVHAYVENKGRIETSFLSYAIEHDMPEITQLLLQQDEIDVNAGCPLLPAVKKQKLDLVKQLIDAGANPAFSAKPPYSEEEITPLQYATENCGTEMRDLLLSAPALKIKVSL